MQIRCERIDKHLLILRPQAWQRNLAYLAQVAESLQRGQIQPIGLLRSGLLRLLAERP